MRQRRELVMITLVFGVATIVLLYLAHRRPWPPSRTADMVMWLLRLSLVGAIVWLVYWAAEPPDDSTGHARTNNPPMTDERPPVHDDHEQREPRSVTGTITCPSCGRQSIEKIAEDYCLFFYECLHCRTVLRPKPGDCCVFCSYGDQQCPSARAISLTGHD